VVINLFNFFRHLSPLFHTVIRMHLISLSYHILVFLPSHLSSMEQMLMLMLLMCRLVDVFARLHPIVSSFGHHHSSLSAIVHCRSKALTCGTVFPTRSLHGNLDFLSGVNLRRFCFAHHILTPAARRFNCYHNISH